MSDMSYYNSTMTVNFLRSHRSTVCRIETGDYVASGDARCDPEDSYDVKTGDALAFARAMETLARKYRKLAQARMNTAANDRATKAKAKEWHAKQAYEKDRVKRHQEKLDYFDLMYGPRNQWATGRNLLQEGSGLDYAQAETAETLNEVLSPFVAKKTGKFGDGFFRIQIKNGQTLTVNLDSGDTSLTDPA